MERGLMETRSSNRYWKGIDGGMTVDEEKRTGMVNVIKR